MLEYEWKYCGTCDMMMIICPHCGNNCCDGGGDECCDGAYAEMDRAYMEGNEPKKPDNWEDIRNNVFNQMFG